MDVAITGEDAVEYKSISYVELTCSVKPCVGCHIEKVKECQLDTLSQFELLIQ